MSKEIEEIYKKVKTVKELHQFLGKLVKLGKGDVPIYFDTDARTFEYHLAKIGAVSLLPKEMVGEEELCFYEER